MLSSLRALLLLHLLLCCPLLGFLDLLLLDLLLLRLHLHLMRPLLVFLCLTQGLLLL